MVLTAGQRKFFKIALVLGVGILLIAITINLVAQNSIKKFLQEELAQLNSNAEYSMSISDVSVGVLRGNITLKEVAIRPTDSLRMAMEDEQNDVRSIREATFKSLKLKGFSVLGYLINKDVNLSGVRLEELNYTVVQNSSIKVSKDRKKQKFTLDSLRIPGLAVLDPGKIIIDSYAIEVLDHATGDTLTNYVAKALTMSSSPIVPIAEGSEYHSFDSSALIMELEDQEYTFANGLYRVGFDDLKFSQKDDLLTISNFRYGPVASARETALKYAFTNDIYDARIETLSVKGFDLKGLIASGMITANYVELDSLKMTIFKDKRMP